MDLSHRHHPAAPPPASARPAAARPAAPMPRGAEPPAAAAAAPQQAPVKQSRPRGRPPMRQSHVDGQLRFPCDFQFTDGSICRKSFNRKSDKERHHHTHTNTRNHQCPLCDKAFIQTSALKVHVRTHTKEKPHHCGICQKRFSDSSSLARHRRTHGPPQFACSWCQAKYKTAQLLQRHERSCAQRQSALPAEMDRYSSHPSPYDHTQLWHSTVASHPAARLNGMDPSHIQYTGVGSDTPVSYEDPSRRRVEGSPLSQQSDGQLLNSYTPASSYISDGQAQESSGGLNRDAYSEEPRPQQQSDQEAAEHAQSQHVLQSNAGPLLQFQPGYEQQPMALELRGYPEMFSYHQQADDGVHAIYLEDQVNSVISEQDYGTPARSHTLPIASQHPLSMLGYAASQQYQYPVMIDMLDQYKMGTDVTGCGEPLPSEYDLSQGC